jgi:hypothetical protein
MFPPASHYSVETLNRNRDIGNHIERIKHPVSLQWNPDNLVEYRKVIDLAKDVISNSEDSNLVLNGQKLIVDSYHQQGEYNKEKNAFDKYIGFLKQYNSEEEEKEIFETINMFYNTQPFDALYCYM